MKSGAPIVVMDPDDWLPGYGESHVGVRTQGFDYVIDITYDDVSQDFGWRRELRFEAARCFCQAVCPGPPMMNIDYEVQGALRSLVEYPESEAASAWNAHVRDGGGAHRIRHHRMFFLAENRVVDVFAERFALSEAVRVEF